MIAVDLGVISYDEGLHIQEALHAARTQDTAEDVLLLLEHDPVITFGKSGHEEDLLLSERELAAKDISVRHVNRGGKITCHYPGQLVVYPIMRLNEQQLDLPRFVYNIEETIILTLRAFDVAAVRVDKLRGIWVEDRKIAAIGIEVRQGVTMHGFAMNILDDLRLYRFFIPCGIADRGVTSLVHHLAGNAQIEMKTVKDAVVRNFSAVFGVPVNAHLSREEFQRRYPQIMN